MPLPNPAPNPGPQGHLDHLLQDLALIDVLFGAIRKAEIDALNQWHPNRPKPFRGTVAFYQGLEHLEYDLGAISWEKEDKFNHIRFLSPEGRYPYRARLITARGKVQRMKVGVNPKGNQTRFLIERDNAAFSPQMSLFEQPIRKWQNIWIVSEVDKADHLNVYLAFPYDLSDDRRVLDCLACERIGGCDLGLAGIGDTGTTPGLPQSTPIDFPDVPEKGDDPGPDGEDEEGGERRRDGTTG